MLSSTLTFYSGAALGAASLLVVLSRVNARLLLSRAKHPSLRGHARMSRWLSRYIPPYSYDTERFFASDDAPSEIVDKRRSGFARLAELFRQRHARTLEVTASALAGLSDLQFTAAYRVPLPFSKIVREQLKTGAFLAESHGVQVKDLDGHDSYDLFGSYGVNVFGYDFYKDCMERGFEKARALGPVLGSYHPLVASNVARLQQISGMDEVSFHMSGTEAVMQAVRLARYRSRRTHLVRFCGAYHGWWGDVQPGVGNPVPAHETYTLKDMDETTLRVLRTRDDIACVLVNPIQAMHPNANAPSDSALVDSTRSAHFDRAAYGVWLKRLREVCSERGIALILDEVFVGFRLAPGGAQEYFDVEADLVTYGKTLGGGLPVGVLCGKKPWMKRFDDEHPADICLARGTFNAHPHVMACMHEFLERIDTPEVRALYANLDETWNSRAARLNQLLRAESLPVRVETMSTIWTVCYETPSRYNWMLQYYMRAEGIALSWVGTGRLIFSLNYSDADFEAVAQRFVAAARAMQRDGFFWQSPALTNRAIKQRVLREVIAQLLPRLAARPRAHAHEPARSARHATQPAERGGRS